MSCIFRVGCEKFDVDSFFKTSLLVPVAVFRKGEPRTSRAGSPVSEISGFNIVVSDVDPIKISEQISEAMEYLANHKTEIEKLSRIRNIKMSLDFALPDRGAAVQSDFFPHELLGTLAKLKINLEISRYELSLLESAPRR